MRNLPQHQYLLPPIEVQSQKRKASLKTTSPSLFPNLPFADYSVFWKSEFGKTRLSGSRHTGWVCKCMLVVRLSDGKNANQAAAFQMKPDWRLQQGARVTLPWAYKPITRHCWWGLKGLKGTGQARVCKGLKGFAWLGSRGLTWLECHPPTAWWGRRLQGWW